MATFKVTRKLFSDIDYIEYLMDLEERLYADHRNPMENAVHNSGMHGNKASRKLQEELNIAKSILEGTKKEDFTRNYKDIVNNPKRWKNIEAHIEAMKKGKSAADLGELGGTTRKAMDASARDLSSAQDQALHVGKTRPSMATEGITSHRTGAFDGSNGLKVGETQAGAMEFKGTTGSGEKHHLLTAEGDKRVTEQAKKNADKAGANYVESPEALKKRQDKAARKAARNEKRRAAKEFKKQNPGLSRRELKEKEKEIKKMINTKEAEEAARKSVTPTKAPEVYKDSRPSNVPKDRSMIKTETPNRTNTLITGAGRENPSNPHVSLSREAHTPKGGQSFEVVAKENIKPVNNTTVSKAVETTSKNTEKIGRKFNKKLAAGLAAGGLGLAGAAYLYNKKKKKED
jgi:hypothetical protein